MCVLPSFSESNGGYVRLCAIYPVMTEQQDAMDCKGMI